MKRIVSALLIMVLLLGGCGNEANVTTKGTTEDSEATVSSTTDETSAKTEEELAKWEGIYDLSLASAEWNVKPGDGEETVGYQYYQGEKVLLTCTEDGKLYLYKEGAEKELLLEELSPTYTKAVSWYIDEKYYYVSAAQFLTAFDKEGTLAGRVMLEGSIQDICTLSDGRVVVRVWDKNRSSYLAEVNVENGTKTFLEKGGAIVMNAGEDGTLRVLDDTGIFDYNLETGEQNIFMEWTGTSYDPTNSGYIMDIKVESDRKVELLTTSRVGQNPCVQTLEKIDMEKVDRTILIYRTMYASDDLKNIVNSFNTTNQEYFVRLEDRGAGYYTDFQTKNAVEIMAGKGPDLLDDSTVADIYSLVEKGGVEELSGYLEESGIDKEKYYSLAFGDWDTGKGTYNVAYQMGVNTVALKKEIAGSPEELTIEQLITGLQNYDKKATFNALYEYSASSMLYYFFRMTPDIYGMVDWEQGTCDFNTELFKDILEICKKYGLTNSNKDYGDIAARISAFNLWNYINETESAENEGMVIVGYPENNGMAHQIYSDCIGINANSAHKEGAWQFIEYLLSDASQQKLSRNSTNLPINRQILEDELDASYETCKLNMVIPADKVQAVMEKDEEIKLSTAEDIVARPIFDEKKEELLALIESAQPGACRQNAILDIIIEETELYFEGSKSIEEVIDVIQNRVGLYLAERQ